jgi:hypothetical protein
MYTMKTQWAIRAAIAVAGLAYVLPTVAAHYAPVANPAPAQVAFVTASLSPAQAARQQKVDQFCARIAGLGHAAQR